MSFLKKTATVGGITLLSRVFGFARDVLMAAGLGAGLAADAFVIAFKLPNFFRRLFAEGAFSAGFVPLYTEALTKEKNGDAGSSARQFAETVLSWFIPVLLVFLIIMEVGMAGVVDGLTGGFDGDEDKRQLTITLSRITFPYLVMISLVALFAGILNAHKRFAAAAFAPVLLNICMITALLLAPPIEKKTALYLAYGVAIAGVVQFIWLAIALARAGIRLVPRLPKPSADMGRLMRIVTPAALGAAVIQVNLLVDILLAARFLEEGAVSWLFYADRLTQLTVGVVGVAISTVLLPDLSARFSQKDRAGIINALDRAVRFGLVIALPAALGLIVISDPIITTLFGRGAFTESVASATAAALRAYALGLPAYILVKCLTPAFFADQDTKTPVQIAIVAMVVNIAANLALIGPYGHVGLALGTAISSTLNAVLLAIVLARRGHFAITGPLIRFLAGILLISLLMATIVVFVAAASVDYATGEISRALRLGGIIAVGGLSFGGLVLATGLVPLSEIKALVKRSAS